MTVSDGRPAAPPVPGPPAVPTPSAVAERAAAGGTPTPSQAALAAAPVTGRVAAAVDSLRGITELPLADHADAYQRVHAELQSALGEIDGA